MINLSNLTISTIVEPEVVTPISCGEYYLAEISTRTIFISLVALAFVWFYVIDSFNRYEQQRLELSHLIANCILASSFILFILFTLNDLKGLIL